MKNLLKNVGLAGLLTGGVSAVALAAGLYTNLLQGVTPPTVNGSAVCSVTGAAGLAGGTNCSTSVPTLSQLSPWVNTGGLVANYQSGPNLIPVDTGLAQGAAPQTVAATPFQIAAMFASVVGNTASAAVGGTSSATTCAVTINTKGGVATCTGAATVAGGTLTLTLTDSAIGAADTALQVAAYLGTATTGALQPTSYTMASGTATVVFTNTATSALNGSVVIPWHL